MTKKKKAKKGIRWLVVVLGLLLIIALAVGWQFYKKIYLPNVETGGKEMYLYIATGSSENAVLDSLLSMGVLKDADAYQWMAEQKNYQGRNVVPGKYPLKDGMSNNELLNHLRAGNGRVDVAVQFNQIQTKAQLAGRLAHQIEPDSLTVYQWLTHADSIAAYGFTDETIMAMFIPNTYYLTWNTSTPQLMQRMAREYKAFWTAERQAKAQEAGLTQSEVVTLASIVYWETKKPEDMPKVAGVYMNRLKVGMPLQADPTLIFAIGDFSMKRVLNKDKEIESPYNTYKYLGLPPGPILIPPIIFVDAVLNYEKHDYYYFVAKEDMSGDSYFAKTYQQHLVYARRYQKALNEQGVMR
jgi:UPF0755 protein